jgi:hypothetical protein
VLAVYAATLMVSALLLFLVQPMFAKMILPSLGGTPAVWNTCMVFFQAMLLLGYGYAHLGTRFLTPKRQAGIHVVLLAVSLLALPIWPRMVDPGDASPIPWLIGVLFVSLGLPFFMLSATAPLLQRWFAASGHAHARDPYFLYGASNLGSLAALLGYPVLVEPLLRLRQQSFAWSIGYDLLVILISLSAWLLKRAIGRNDAMPAPTSETAIDDTPLTWARRGRWIALAFVPSSLMLGLTTYVTTDLAAVPLLWVIPLAVYLLTFVIVFARRPFLRHSWMVRAQPFLLLPVVILLLWPNLNHKIMVWLMAPLHLVLFFACTMVCHGELAKDRPDARHLTEFYLWMSVGGVLGGLFNALFAPLAFNGVYEYPIAIALACMLRPNLGKQPASPRAPWFDIGLPVVLGGALLIYLLRIAGGDDAPSKAMIMIISIAVGLLLYSCRLRPMCFGLAVGAALLAGLISAEGSAPVLLSERSFFGVHRITLDGGGDYKTLMHGTTIHGAQATDLEEAKEPLTYYHRDGPLGQIFDMLEGRLKGARVGAIGLGSGSVACYAVDGRKLTFFEIDPVVVAFASDPKYFSYVATCGETRPDFVLGDARLTLEQQPDGAFGLLIVDAFSSDAIPLHLITREAIELYLRKLAPGGGIAVHISNRYLDLAPVLAAIARELGLAARVSDESGLDEEERDNMRFPATWLALARAPADLGNLMEDEDWIAPAERPDVPAWTDDFSNILSVLHFRTKGD